MQQPLDLIGVRTGVALQYAFEVESPECGLVHVEAVDFNRFTLVIY
jgi:hypothetical protein